MNRISTQLDIIRYIYKELEEKETQQIKDRSYIDSNTNNLIDFFEEIKCELDGVMLTPSDRIVESIKKLSSTLKVTNKDFV